MAEVKWKLKNIKTNEVVYIDKPIFKVGRHLDADFKTELCEVSRNHATLSILVGDLLYVHDNKSCNGTFINQRKIEPMENVLLNHGDIVGFGMNKQMVESSQIAIPLIFEVSREVSSTTAHTGHSVNNSKVIEILDSFEEIQVNCSGNENVVEDVVEVDVDMTNKKNVELAVDVENVCEGRIVDTNVKIPIETQQKIIQKMTPTEGKVGTKLQYTVNEGDCIVISDGEDDEPFAQSQIFDISEKIKLEQTSYHDSIDPYFEVKQELKDLECDAENQIPVDLTEDVDHFETTSELLNILEASESQEEKRDKTSQPFSSLELKVLLEKDLVQKKEVEKNCIRTPEDVSIPISSKKKADAVHGAVTKDKRGSDKEKHKQVNPADVVVEELLCRKSPRRLQHSSKTMTLQVIPPMNAKSYVSNEKREVPSKRKSAKFPFESKKKLKTTKTDKTAVQTCGQMTAQEKKEIALARKQKLREIAVKQSAESNSKEKCPKVAVSSVCPTPSTSSGVTGDPRQRRQGKNTTDRNVRRERSAPQTYITDNYVIQDSTVSSNFSPKSDFNQNLFKRPAATITNNRSSAFPPADSTVPEDRSGIIWNLGKKSQPISTVSRHPCDVTGEIHRIVRWSVGWLVQQNHLEISPPVYGDQLLVRVPHYFESFSEYEAVMSPLILLELWELIHHTAYSKEDERNLEEVFKELHRFVGWSIEWLVQQNQLDTGPSALGKQPLARVPRCFESFSEYESVMSSVIVSEMWGISHRSVCINEDERRPFTASVTHVRKMDQVAILDCQVNMQETNANSNMFRPEDFCLIELRGTDIHRNIQQTTKYGYIEHVNRMHQGGVSCVRFTLLTSNFNISLLGSAVLVKVIVNVSSSLRLFKTIKCLASSPLCRYVLNPNTIRAQHGISSENIALNTTCNLNKQQKDIVAEASELCLRKAAGIYLMKGPPGTGKSTVIANIICNVLSKSIASGEPALILLTAPSNAAVDGLLLKLNDYRSSLTEEEKKNIKLVRVGPDSSISEKVGNFKSRVLARNHILRDKGLVSLEDYALYLKNKWDLEQFLRRHLGQRFTYEMNNAEDLVLYKSNVICTTLNSCVGYKILQLVRKGLMKFTCCVIDEATQCTEVESLIPIQLGIDKFVLVGDPQQLPAVVCNKDAQHMGYGNSFFSRIDDNFKNRSWCPIKTLTNQYRMKSEICEFPNKAYYEGKLISCPVISNPIEPPVKPYMVFNLTRAESRDYSDYVNTDESLLICTLLRTLKECLNSTCKYTIGIITPYKAQKELLLRDISNIRMPLEVSVTVNTVDSFQGMENDVVIISCVRYTSNYFLQSDQRLNVALTRAKQALYIIGNYTLFKKCRPLYDLREDAKRRKCLFDIHEDPRNISTLRRFLMERRTLAN